MNRFVAIIRNTNTGARRIIGVSAHDINDARSIAYEKFCKKQIDIIETIF